MGISTGQDLQSYAGTRVTIAGGTGFIGRWVARALSDSGAELTLLARDLAAARAIAGQFGFTCRFIPLDLTDFAAVTRNLAGLRPQILFNLAAYGINAAESDLSTARRINHELLPVLCDALAEVDAGGWAGRRLVHAGSVAEYGPVVETLDESMPAHPRSLYGSTKLAGTEAVQRCCLSSGMNGVTARLFGVYGPGERPGRLLPVLMDAARLQRVAELGPAGQQRDFLFVEDVAEGLLRVGISAGQPGETIHLASGVMTSVGSFAGIAARILGLPAERVRFDALKSDPHPVQHGLVSIARLKERTGWVPPACLESGLRRAIAFESQFQTRRSA